MKKTNPEPDRSTEALQGASRLLEALAEGELSARSRSHQLRKRILVENLDATHARIDGRIFTNFCANNYLGLTHHPRVLAAMQNSIEQSGAGAGAAGLISGFTPVHLAAETAVAAWKGTQAALLLPSGYQANHAAVQTFTSLGQSRRGKVRFLLDKLSHASLLDAVMGTDAPWRIFNHNGMSKLKRLLSDAPKDQLQVVVTESIFSMDGDAADLMGLAELKKQFDFVLLLDEAHGSGVYGPGGAGLAAELGLSGCVDVSIATFSKAAGVVGGAICGSRRFCDAVLNFGRAYIYSTSIPPAIAAGIEAAVAVMRQEPKRQERVRRLARLVRERLKAGGLKLPPEDSPIVPIIVGDEASALGLAKKLYDMQLLVQAVRPPTVGRGASRVRVTLSSEHTDEEIERLIGALGR